MTSPLLSSLCRRAANSPFLIGTLVLLAVLAVYGQVCSFAFLPFWDDDTNIHRNPLYSPLSWGSITLFWKAPFQQLYIPVTYSVWGGLVALSRLAAGRSMSVGPVTPLLFHGVNLLVHLLATAMVFLILRRLLAAQFGGRGTTTPLSEARLLGGGVVGALAFALHPVQVEAVAWVSGLRDLLGGAFSLASIALFLGFLEESGSGFKRWGRYAIATLCLLLAFGSKPGSVVTPALALLTGAWLIQARKNSLRQLWWLLPWFVAALLEVVMTSRSQPAAALAESLVPLWARPLVAADALAFYLGKLLWPWGLCADYGRSPNVLFDSGVLFWSGCVPLFLVVVLSAVKKLHAYLVPFGIFVIGTLPTLGLIPFNFQIVSTVTDHYLYLAMLGPGLAFALAICQVSFRRAFVTALVLLSFWTTLTLCQLPEWADGNTFFQATLARNPTSWKSCHNYACTLDGQGKYPEALREFDEAIRLRPSNAEAHNDRALTLMKLNRYQEAVLCFQRSLQIRATAGAARNLAAVLLLANEPTKAVQVYRLALQIDPGDLQNQRALAWLLATHPDDHVRDGREAVALAQQIVTATRGEVPLFLFTLSAALAETGEFPRATSVAIQAAQAYQSSGDAPMARFIEQKILPALDRHQALRDNPARAF